MDKFLSFITMSVLANLAGMAEAHVSLTFPTARQIDLDFLDFFRTKPPCGMPKGKYRTILKAGSTINVTWHLSYPHRGGYQIELLDKNESFLMKLSQSTSNDSYIRGDPTAQWVSVMIPDMPCEDCTIRLLREVQEWKDYGYWSCGDVSIVKSSEYKENCMGRGMVDTNWMCKCEKGYWGPRCQYKDECENDMDCGQGKCVEIEGTTLPRKQCFCSAGFHGDRCQIPNKDMLPTPDKLELSSHTKTELSDRVTMYHKLLGKSATNSDNEVEFVLVVNGTSYIAVGWRPSALDISCKTMPYIDDNILSRKKRSTRGRPYKSNPTLLEPLHMPERIVAEIDSSMNSKRSTKGRHNSKNSFQAESPRGVVQEPSPIEEPKQEPTAEAEAISEPEGKPETSNQLEKQHNANAKADAENAGSELEPVSEPEGQSEASNEPISEPEATGQDSKKPENSPAKPKRYSSTKPQPKGSSEPTSEPEASSEPISEPEASSEPISEPEASSEPISEPEASSEPKSEPEASSEPKSEPEASSEPKSEPEASSEPISEPEASSEPKSEPEASSEPKSEPEASSEPISEPNSSSEPVSEPKAENNPTSGPESQNEPNAEPEASVEPISEPEGVTNSKPKKTTRSVGPEAKPIQVLDQHLFTGLELEQAEEDQLNPSAFVMTESQSSNTMAWDQQSPFKLEHKNTSYTPKLNHFHPMDCSDVIVSTARGMYSRVRDSYTRDSSSPRPDSVYGGTHDITSATGWEINGVTTIIFRRKVKTSDPTDHELSGSLHFIWARGQEYNEYVHEPKSGLETENPSIPKFYGQDELKYHGQMSQRGVITLTL